MKKGSKKTNKKKLIIILICVAVFFAALALIVHETTKITNESYENCALGDVNGDGYINSMDALLVIEGNANNDLLFDNQKKHADVNRDGKADSADALVLLRYTVGEINKLPYNDSIAKKEEQEKQIGNGRSADCNGEQSYAAVQIVNEWDNGDGTRSYQLNVSVKNISDSEIESWNSKIVLSGAAEISKSWDCKTKMNSDEITVKGDSVPVEAAATCGLIISAPEGLKINSISIND